MNFSPILNGTKRWKRLMKLNDKRVDEFNPENTILDAYFISINLDNSQTDRECEEKLYGRLF